MQGLPPEAWVLFGTALTGLSGWIAARTTAKSQEEQAEVTSRGPDWKSFTDSIRSELDEQRDVSTALRERVDGLESEVFTLREELAGVKGLYRVMRDYARGLFATHPDPAAPPDDVKHEFS